MRNAALGREMDHRIDTISIGGTDTLEGPISAVFEGAIDAHEFCRRRERARSHSIAANQREVAGGVFLIVHSANTSPCRACRGLPPPSECLSRAPKGSRCGRTRTGSVSVSSLCIGQLGCI